jgi:hypothetical protein
MSQRWRKVTLAPEDLPLVVLWSEMLAATGLAESRAWQLVQERSFPIRHLPYHGYSPRGRKRNIGRNQIDSRGFTFSKVEVLKFIALPEDKRYGQTLLEWELPAAAIASSTARRMGRRRRSTLTLRGSGRDGGTGDGRSREVRRRDSGRVP